MFRFILTLKESRKLYPWHLIVLKQGFAKVINCWTNRFGAFDYHKVEKYDVEIICVCRDFRIFFFIYFIGIHWKEDDLLSHIAWVYFRFTTVYEWIFYESIYCRRILLANITFFFRYHSQL